MRACSLWHPTRQTACLCCQTSALRWQQVSWCPLAKHANAAHAASCHSAGCAPSNLRMWWAYSARFPAARVLCCASLGCCLRLMPMTQACSGTRHTHPARSWLCVCTPCICVPLPALLPACPPAPQTSSSPAGTSYPPAGQLLAPAQPSSAQFWKAAFSGPPATRPVRASFISRCCAPANAGAAAAMAGYLLPLPLLLPTARLLL